MNWTGDIELVKRLESNVDRALKWIDDYANLKGNGFTYNAFRSPSGIYNQCWKDSFDSISHADGTLAKKPIAVAEAQGYVYMAKRRLATLFMHLGRECDVVSSNPAQCLWTGIIDSKYAKQLVGRLFKDYMFTGSGIRTLSSGERRYNPIGYNNGTIWPHDNAFIVAGLHKYGFVKEMSILFTGMYEAAKNFELYRLPECFSGLSRSEYSVPVKYPVACSPQALSSGAIPFMFTASPGIAPDALNNRLVINNPYLPLWLDNVQFNNVKVDNTLTDLDFRRVDNETPVNVYKKRGDINVLIE